MVEEQEWFVLAQTVTVMTGDPDQAFLASKDGDWVYIRNINDGASLRKSGSLALKLNQGKYPFLAKEGLVKW